MTSGRKSIVPRVAVVLAAVLTCGAAVTVKSGAAFGSYAANMRARAAMLADIDYVRSAALFPHLAEGGDEYALVEDAGGNIVWRSPSLGQRFLPKSDDDISSAVLPDGRKGWVATVATARGRATYGSTHAAFTHDLLRFVGPPFILLVLPTAVLAWLYPGRSAR